MKTPAMESSSCIQKQNSIRRILASIPCKHIEHPGYLGAKWCVLATSTGQLLPLFGSAMSCSSGSPVAVQLQTILCRRLPRDSLLLFMYVVILRTLPIT